MPKIRAKRALSTEDEWGCVLDDADSEPSSDAQCSRGAQGRRRHRSRAREGGRRRGAASCQVKGCQADLYAIGKRYCLRKRVCPEHLIASQVELAASCDSIFRFCHHCGKFEPADSFDDGKRSCRARLLKRRFNQQANRIAKRQAGMTPGASGTSLPVRGVQQHQQVQQLMEGQQQWDTPAQAGSDPDRSLLRRLSSPSSSWTSGSMEQIPQAEHDPSQTLQQQQQQGACRLPVPGDPSALQLQLDAVGRCTDVAMAGAASMAPTAADAAAAVAAAAGLLPLGMLSAEPTAEEILFEEELENLLCCQLACASSTGQQQQEGGDAKMTATTDLAVAGAAAAAPVAPTPGQQQPDAVPAAGSPANSEMPSAADSAQNCSSGSGTNSSGDSLMVQQQEQQPEAALDASAPAAEPGYASAQPEASRRSSGSLSTGTRPAATAVTAIAADADTVASNISSMLEPSPNAVRWPSAEKRALLDQLMELMYEDTLTGPPPALAALGGPPVTSSLLPGLSGPEHTTGTSWQCLLGRESSSLGGACSSTRSPDAATAAAALGHAAGVSPAAATGVSGMLHPGACAAPFTVGRSRYVVQMMPVLSPVDGSGAAMPLAAAASGAWTAAAPLPLPPAAASAGLPPVPSFTAARSGPAQLPGSRHWSNVSAGGGRAAAPAAAAATAAPGSMHVQQLGVLHRQLRDVTCRLAELQSLVTAETQAAVAAAAAGCVQVPPSPTAPVPCWPGTSVLLTPSSSAAGSDTASPLPLHQQLFCTVSSAASSEFGLQLLQTQAQGSAAGSQMTARMFGCEQPKLH